MKTPLFFLALLTLLAGALFAQEVEKLSEPKTLLFIRTVPEGASVLIDGKKVGATDDLFRVEPGVRRIVIELDGHTPQSKELTIRAGRITRLVLQLKQSQSPTGAAVSKTTDAVAPALKAVINDADSMQGREAIDLDHAQLFNLPDANGWSRQQADDWLADNNIDLVAEYENNLWTLITRGMALNPIGNDRWDTMTATELDKVLSGEVPSAKLDIKVREQRSSRFHTLNFGIAAPVTFAFKTVEGSSGVLRIVEFSKLSKRPRSMTILFKLLKPLKGTPPPTKVRVPGAVIPLPPPKTGSLSFGPVIERVVNDDKTGSDWMIDLDTGKVYTPPAELDPEKNSQADTGKLMAWVRQRGIDATGIKAQGGELRFIERVLAVVDKASWESVTQQQVRDALAEVVDPSDKALVGDTLYAFRTREGGVGVLQLVGPGGEDHPSVKIRYKLISGTAASAAADQAWTCAMHPQVNVPKPGRCPLCAMELVARLPQPAKDNPRAAKTIFLPYAETRGVAGVLDLASGELLPISGDKGFSAMREFTRRHHKGDLYHGYDEEDGGGFIGCLRGATAVIWDGNRARPLGSSQKREEVAVYRSPPLPCRLLITTAEKRVFDVTFFSAGKSGESDTGVPRNVSGIRLKYSLRETAGAEVMPTARSETVGESDLKAKSIFLPDVETPDVNVVLDLASGEMLPIADPREFARLGKGDLLYDDANGGSLGFVRGAETANWNGPPHSPTKRRTYKLLPLPCRLLIKTAEDKVFAVTILRADRSRESDKGVPRNVPGIRVKYELGDSEIVPRAPVDAVEEAKPVSGSKSAPEAKTFFLPDVETPKVGVVLDLGSGRMLPPISNPAEGLREYANLDRTRNRDRSSS